MCVFIVCVCLRLSACVCVCVYGLGLSACACVKCTHRHADGVAAARPQVLQGVALTEMGGVVHGLRPRPLAGQVHHVGRQDAVHLRRASPPGQTDGYR